MKAFLARMVMLLIGFILLVQLWIFASLAWWRTQPVETTMFMRLDYWADLKPIQQQWRDYDDISNNFKHAILAAEDAKFMQHHGFDIQGIQDALARNSEQGKKTLVLIMAINLVFGFTVAGINNAAHIGGMLMGAALAGTWYVSQKTAKTRVMQVVVFILAAVLLLAFYAYCSALSVALQQLWYEILLQFA